MQRSKKLIDYISLCYSNAKTTPLVPLIFWGLVWGKLAPLLGGKRRIAGFTSYSSSHGCQVKLDNSILKIGLIGLNCLMDRPKSLLTNTTVPQTITPTTSSWAEQRPHLYLLHTNTHTLASLTACHAITRCQAHKKMLHKPNYKLLFLLSKEKAQSSSTGSLFVTQ